MGSKKREGKYIVLSIFFCLLVFASVGISLAIKLANTIFISSFDDKHQFIVFIEKNNNAKSIVIFLPDNKTISSINFLDNKDASSSGKYFYLPIDAQIYSPGSNNGISYLKSAILNGDSKNTLTFVDKFKLWLFASQIKETSFKEENISISENPENVEKVVLKYSQDPTLYQDGKTVAVINSSGITGGGARVAKLLSNLGANVVSVTSSDKLQDFSKIYYSGKTSYTTLRFQKIFKIIPEKNTSNLNIADVILVVGKDKSSNL